MQGCGKKMRYESESSIYVHTKTESSSHHNNLKYYFNDDTNCDYIIHKVYVDHKTYYKYLFQINPFKGIVKMARQVKYECYIFLMGTGNKFVMNCYNIF